MKSSTGTPRKVTTSSEARQFETRIAMGTAETTPSMFEMRSTYHWGSRLVKGHQRFSR